MAHLTPFLAIAVVTLLASDRGLSAVRSAAALVVTAARDIVAYVRTVGRRYARLTFGP